ncbi:MAG: TylF/MycF/NovP-related O-methyltransferase [Tepidisphaeraceae bacterium]
MFYWIPPDKLQTFNQALKDIAELYPGCFFANDMLMAMGRNLSFLDDRQFTESFNSTAITEHDKSLVWRLHVLAWAANHALKIPGDFVECGVFQGLSSAVLCKYLDFAKVGKAFYLYDTFAGLPEETSTEKERRLWNPAYTEDPSTWLAEVRRTFAQYPNVKIIPGIVPASLERESPRAIAYLHIDMNSARAEILALERLFDRVSPGGLIVLDDFGWVCNRDQTVAELEFMRKRNHAVLELPTGQGLVLKR